MTFIEDGNLDYLPVVEGATDIVNLDKMRKVASVISEILLYQQKPYAFHPVEPIYNFFTRAYVNRAKEVLSPEVCFAKSQSVETKAEITEFLRKGRKK